MKTLLLTLCLGAALICSACASKSTPADDAPMDNAGGKPVETYDEVNAGTEFTDITLPADLTRVSDETNFFETKQFKMGILVYEGRVDYNSLIDFMINTMVKRKWIVQSTLKSTKSTLVFDKPNKSCVIQISEGTIYTRMAITAVELKTPGSSSAQESAPAAAPAAPSSGTGKPKSGELKPAFKNEKNIN